MTHFMMGLALGVTLALLAVLGLAVGATPLVEVLIVLAATGVYVLMLVAVAHGVAEAWTRIRRRRGRA